MSRRSRKLFSKLSHVFDKHFSRSPRIQVISIDADASAEVPHTQPLSRTTTGSPRPGVVGTSELIKSSSAPAFTTTTIPSISPPHADALPNVASSNQPATPTSLPNESIQLIKQGSYQAPVPEASMSSDSSTSTIPQAQSHGVLNHAHDLVITRSHFTNYSNHYNISPPGFGLEKLLDKSMPDAFHDSAARYPPPRCHLGTRKEYIAQVTDWAFGESDRRTPILWMHGPFGIGKTAVAQSCAEALKTSHKLLATLFFSRSNANRADPLRVFTSIAYQIATQCRVFASIIDTRIREDLSLTSKSLSTQFEELLVVPLRQIGTTSNGLEGRVIIIVGLDECRGTAEQCEIIKIIAASASTQSTPFRWFITSRPEDPIVRAMRSSSISPAISRLELPVSRDIDHEILVFLTDEFTKIRENHDLPESWPGEEALALLVERGAGLWIYVSTIVRFIKDEGSFGPEDQLRIVLEFAESVTKRVGPNNPLAEMDFFYTLILQQIPLNIRTTIRKILLIHFMYPGEYSKDKTDVLCLSLDQFRRACASIKSVMELRGDSPSMELHFYHTSFLDFLADSTRSQELCILGEFLVQYRRELLERLQFIFSHTTGLVSSNHAGFRSMTILALLPDSSHFVLPSSLPENVQSQDHYSQASIYFWRFCCFPNHPIDTPSAIAISNFPFRKMFSLLPEESRTFFSRNYMSQLRPNLPLELRDKIHRQDKCPTPGCTNPEPVLLFGCGENEAIGKMDQDGDLRFENNQNPPAGKCPCGGQIERDDEGGPPLGSGQVY
ncbi:hypothetical protein NP233_g6449 [Leucocoprinus birnbaumii]|uniref:Nephrocystin 3-like N-terminal domain-containing protein n=1 Tax=Leucocoprinus birnbaumii TaxID=56174 RepID=A0AAD5VR06_9AGAR|nr:hypothetical protein NP233_g6449 [Leucocoprinus birnbaumii]